MTQVFLAFLAIEFVDEFVGGAMGAAWPAIRTDLGLTYVQIGLIFSIPALAGNLVEPALGVLGDVWRRRTLILGGGALFAASLALFASSPGFLLLLIALVIFYPASGAFVTLSQASLMDSAPSRHEQNMARWTFAGSVGIVLGALVMALAASMGLGWRPLFWAFAAMTVLVLAVANGIPLGGVTETGEGRFTSSFRSGAANAFGQLRRPWVLRWLVLLQFSDLMLDGLHGYLALYFVDVARVSPSSAALAVATWTGFGLLGDLLLIPLLERVRGLTYLRFSALANLFLFAGFLLVPGLGPKLAIVALLGLGNAGWYAVLKAQLYSTMPGQSGTVMAVSSVGNVASALVPLGIGAAAAAWGLDTAMWLLLAGPVALLLGIPRSKTNV